MRTMYWFGVESRMIFMCSMTSLNGAISFMRSWLVMVAGTVRMHTIALRLTSSVSDVILLQQDKKIQPSRLKGADNLWSTEETCQEWLTWSCRGAWCRGWSPLTGSRWRKRSGPAAAWRGSQEQRLWPRWRPVKPRFPPDCLLQALQPELHCSALLIHLLLYLQGNDSRFKSNLTMCGSAVFPDSSNLSDSLLQAYWFLLNM